MTCKLDACAQGRCPCPAPEECADTTPFRPIRYAIGYLSVWLRWQDHAASKRAGHLAAITKPQEPDGIVLAGREPISGEAKVLIAAVTVTWLTVMALSIQDLPDRIFALWPTLVALASF
jgi:hypothetical protein